MHARTEASPSLSRDYVSTKSIGGGLVLPSHFVPTETASALAEKSDQKSGPATQTLCVSLPAVLALSALVHVPTFLHEKNAPCMLSVHSGSATKKTTAAGAMFAGWGKGNERAERAVIWAHGKQGDPIEHPTTSEHGRESLPGVPPNLHSTRPAVPSPELAEERTAEPIANPAKGLVTCFATLRNPSQPIRRRRLVLSERPPVLPGAILGTLGHLGLLSRASMDERNDAHCPHCCPDHKPTER
jgi:hypothetical protein